jgi:hypothetical protein
MAWMIIHLKARLASALEREIGHKGGTQSELTASRPCPDASHLHLSKGA